ncbi:hypothetical protein [Streptomyces sp. NPDC015131]|uniref:hypothetical protein n=1 Tax=Streptomyces sp. NPDC015131 TaxID=3364941 RepID=UPI0036F50D07
MGITVYAPPGTDIRTTDKIQVLKGHRYQGATFQVTGEPGDWGRSAFTGTHGPVQFAADRIKG